MIGCMDEILTAIAAALAGKAADATFEGGRKALATLKNLVRERFRNDKDAQVALEEAQRAPDQAVATTALATAIERVCATDPDFAAQLRSLWLQVTNQSVTNIVTGNIGGHLIQAHDIHGDINF
jgi:hypothetical protein